MCIAASQGAAHGGDDSVVLQQLCSLGSVLAGGKSVDAAADEGGAGGGADPYSGGDGGNNSRGSSSRDEAGGGNLLTRWLQPAMVGGVGSSGSKVVRDGGDALPGDADTAPQSSAAAASGGSRIVGEWAKKALLRKKLADAERGRQLRLQLEDAPSVSEAAGDHRAEENSGEPRASASLSCREAVKTSTTTARSAAATVPETTPARAALPVYITTMESAVTASSLSSSTTARTDAAAADGWSEENPSKGTGVTSLASDPPCAGSGMSGGTPMDDEYGDEFSFLTDADLQAMEEKATVASAALSQQGSQQAGQGNILMATQTPPAIQSRSAGDPDANRNEHDGKPGARQRGGAMNPGSGGPFSWRSGGSGMNKSSSVRPSREHDMAGLKRRVERDGSRPPLSTLAPNPKWSYRRHQRQATTSTARKQHGSSTSSSQGGEDDSACPSHQRLSQGRVAPGRGDGARNARRTTPDCIASARGSKLENEVGTGIGEASSGQGAPRSRVAAAANAASAAGINDSKLFTAYSSMEEFTKSNGPGQLEGRHGPGAVVPEKGQARLTGWTKQPPLERQADASVSATSVSRSAIPFVPALVHRRFLVLEVTYVSARRGDGSREKVLMALEQHPKEYTAAPAAADEPGAEASFAKGEGGGGAGVAQQRKITLLGDWYDCEVEPGDVAHVLFPVGAGDQRAASIDIDGEEDMLRSRHVVVDNASGRLLVVHPDILVSPTKVADTVTCNRKAVLQSRLASDASKSKPAVLGNLKHELFEKSLLAAAAAVKSTAPSRGTGSSGASTNGRGQSPAARAASAWQRDPGGPGRGTAGGLLTFQYMSKLVDGIVLSQLEALYGAGLDEDAARRELLSVSGPILEWHRAFLVRRSGAVLSGGGGGDAKRQRHHLSDQAGPRGAARTATTAPSPVEAAGEGEGGLASLGPDGTPAVRVSVCRVLATEDDVWSPVLGLKGIMDATVEALPRPLVRAAHGRRAGNGMELPAGMVLGDGGHRGPVVMPVEIKTGKRIGDAHTSHRAQVSCVEAC